MQDKQRKVSKGGARPDSNGSGLGALGALGLSVGESAEEKERHVAEVEAAVDEEHVKLSNAIVEAEAASAAEAAAAAATAKAEQTASAGAGQAEADAAGTADAAAFSGEEALSKAREEHRQASSRRFTKRTIVSFFIVIIAIPATILGGWMLGDRNYYITSVLIIIFTMIPFFMVFENRKPQARELVIIAVLTAIAVAGRAAFIWAPFITPIFGLIMITGAALGAEAGFLTGALAVFVSNFIFGQGPWTPWQMFAYGIAGFISGLLVRKGILKVDRVPMAVFGGVVTLVLIGFLLDTCALFLMASVVSWESAIAIYSSGLPVNIAHAISTVVTILLVSKPLLDKIERVKAKYGLLED